MIHSITANQASFSPVIFTSGLNIILGELSAKSAPKDTRNGLGKSTIIEIINFCLGGSSSEKLPEESLKQWIFTIDLTINGDRIKATRALAAPDKINIEGNTNNCLIKPIKDLLEEYYTVDQWNQVLGDAMFGISTTEEKNVPTFRGLIQFFLRRTHDAYSEPFSYFRNQPAWQKQLYISFLLGFDWHLAQKQQALTDRKKILDNMKSALKAGVINFSGSLGELEAEQIIIQQKVNRINNQLSTFQVHPEYEYIRKEADKITTKLQKLNNINVTDSIKLSRYEEALCQEAPPVDKLLPK